LTGPRTPFSAKTIQKSMQSIKNFLHAKISIEYTHPHILYLDKYQ
jgi:hypothetical protein